MYNINQTRQNALNVHISNAHWNANNTASNEADELQCKTNDAITKEGPNKPAYKLELSDDDNGANINQRVRSKDKFRYRWHWYLNLEWW